MPELVYYVYIFFYLNGIPCYVGKGKGRRWKRQFNSSHNIQLRGLLKKTDGKLPVVIFRDELSEKDAFDIEVALIKAIGRRDTNSGPLLNHTDGGDGVSGHKHTKQSRDKIKAALALAYKTNGVQIRRTLSNAQKKRGKRSKEFCEIVSKATKGKKKTRTPKLLAVMRARKGRKASEGSRLALLSGAKRPKSKLHRERIGLVTKGTTWWHTPNGIVYRAVEKRSNDDLPGSLSLSTKGQRWWHTPDGTCYVSFNKRSEDDLVGRK
jgi:hypothetical protein